MKYRLRQKPEEPRRKTHQKTLYFNKGEYLENLIEYVEDADGNMDRAFVSGVWKDGQAKTKLTYWVKESEENFARRMKKYKKELEKYERWLEWYQAHQEEFEAVIEEKVRAEEIEKENARLKNIEARNRRLMEDLSEQMKRAEKQANWIKAQKEKLPRL